MWRTLADSRRKSPVSPSPEPAAPATICVVDTSILIEFKRLVKIDEQWDVLAHMLKLVEDGSLTFPRQVAKELQEVRFPDAPGAWIGHAKGKICHPQPDDATLARVLAVAEQLVDLEATHEREVADPYVAAMAIEIVERDLFSRVVVATNDRVDRLPAKLSLLTACARLGLDCWTPEEFLAWVSAGGVTGAG